MLIAQWKCILIDISDDFQKFYLSHFITEPQLPDGDSEDAKWGAVQLPFDSS